MNLRRHFKFAAIAIALVAFAQLSLAQTAGDGKIANMTVGAGGVRWDVLVANAGGSVTVSFPDGRSFKKAFRAGGAPEIDLSDKQIEGLPDGVYTYELRLAPVLTGAQKESMMKARGNDDEPEAERAARKRPVVPSLVQHGSFAVFNGALVGPGAIEGERTGSTTVPQQIKQPATPARVSANTITRLRNHRFSLGVMPDQVIPDDLIVQGSACVGLDCVNNETFSFDTIRMKENNTRISFNDTSVGTFPTNDWTIRANSNANGGASFLAFVDRGANSVGDETGTIVFEVDAGAPANSLKVSSSGNVGIKTATPVLDIHANNSNTPAIRLEQNNSGGFTAQTFDIGSNEANFFVRDVTGGSRLPLRIRPGAPTSSVDIAASGNVGIGTASPVSKLHAVGTITADGGTTTAGTLALGSASNAVVSATTSALLTINAGNYTNVSVNGNVGIGTTSPDQKLSVQGDADKSSGGTSWGVFSDERLKDIKGGYTRGLSAVMGLRPVRFSYKKDNALKLQSDSEIIGFSAQKLQTMVPEAVTRNANGYLVVHSDPILWAMLNAIQEQQKEIADLKAQVHKLRHGSRRHK